MKEEKNDLRIIKTKRDIRNAFLKLRSTTQLEKIKVQDICSLAEINKSTFYRHYTDVLNLSDELENDVIQKCMDHFKYKDCLLSDPKLFLSNVPKAVNEEKDVISILFRDRDNIMSTKLERALRDYYRHPAMTPTEDIRLAFLIGGSIYAMRQLSGENKYSTDKITDCTAELISKCCE